LMQSQTTSFLDMNHHALGRQHHHDMALSIHHCVVAHSKYRCPCCFAEQAFC
jgi:hypothetical protein